MDEITKNILIEAAKVAAMNAYVPYSNLHIGAAVLAKSGKIYTGCNIENVSFSATICAERVAIVKAISEGEKEITAIAIYSEKAQAYPCGICLQVIAEFGGNTDIIVASKKKVSMYKINELLPYIFNSEEQKIKEDLT